MSDARDPIEAAGTCATSASSWTDRLRDGSLVRIRPLCAADAELELDFLARCSPQSRRQRFLGTVQPTMDLARSLTRIDRENDLAFVALFDPHGQERVDGISRCHVDPGKRSAECAVLVCDDMQGKGLAVLLMRHLIELARMRGLSELVSIDSASNHGMRELASFLGFDRRSDPGDTTQVIHTLKL